MMIQYETSEVSANGQYIAGTAERGGAGGELKGGGLHAQRVCGPLTVVRTEKRKKKTVLSAVIGHGEGVTMSCARQG